MGETETQFQKTAHTQWKPQQMGAGSETYASLMKSFIPLLHCTFSSSSSLGAWDVKKDDVGQEGAEHNKEHVKGDKCQLVTCQN